MPPKPPPDLEYWSVPRCWPDGAVAILAGGRTLTRDDVDHALGRVPVIAINRAFQLAPNAAWLYGCDSNGFWEWHPEAIRFVGTKIVVRPAGNVTSMPAKWPQLVGLANDGVKILRHSGLDYPQSVPRHEGASPDPRIVYGNNGLYQILSVIAHTGARTVLLLGADMRGGHFHGGYNMGEPDFASTIIPNFSSLVRPLERAGVAVLNCCPTSALLCWPRVRLKDVL